MSQLIVDFPNTPPPQSGDTYTAPNGTEYFFDGVKWIGTGNNRGGYPGLPNMTGNAGRWLTTNGIDPRWELLPQFVTSSSFATTSSFATSSTYADTFNTNSFATVAFTGDYNDLLNIPEDVDNYLSTGSLISSLVNDIGYVTATNISVFNNDVGYVTATNIGVFTNDVGYLTTATLPPIPNSTEVLNVLYVSKSGSDTNDGKTLGTSFLTIKAALTAASSGTTIFVKSGDYTELNPLLVPAEVAVVGDNLRTVTVRPADINSDLFYVNNNCYLANMTFKDHLAAAVAFNPDMSAGVITHSPYVQNCTSMTTTGTGMRVDGSLAQGLKSMVCDAYTQYNQGGRGIHLLNDGYAQLVSVFTICCDIAFLAESGGRCSITNSNSSFGNYALVANGTSGLLYTATVATSFVGRRFPANGLSTVPDIGDVIQFAGNSNFYTVSSSSYVSGTAPNVVCDIWVEERVKPLTSATTEISFYRNSVITAAGHTFEWIGAGTDINTCLPTLGGVPVPENQAVQSSGGKVFFTGTDQKGDFRIGTGLIINNNLGTISGRTFTKSLFGIMTPYILAIGR